MDMLLSPVTLGLLVLAALTAGAFLILTIWAIRALSKYLHAKNARAEKEAVQKSLGETLKERRLQCRMTQEFVAEALGVSRQAVSKWEQGKSDPSTSNLLALAKLYQIPPENFLKNVR